MTEGRPQGPLAALHKELRSGKITRREFTLRALALGVGMPIISFILRAETVSATTASGTVARHVGWGVAAQGDSRSARRGDGWPHPRRRRRAEADPVAGAEHAQPARLHRHQGLSGGVPHHRAADALPAGRHAHPESGHRGADGRERPPGRGPQERHLQTARRRQVGGRRAVDRRRRRLHLGVDRRSGQRRRLGQSSTSRSSRWRPSTRRR